MSNALLTVNEVASRLNVTRATVYNLMNKGEIPYTVVGQRRRIEESAIDGYIIRNMRDKESDCEEGRVSLCTAVA
jgi:excisionase family DNA binding protein